MDLTLNDLETIKKRISEAMAEVAKEQQELDNMLKYIATIDGPALAQLSQSGSLAKRNRQRAVLIDNKTAQEEKEEYERKRQEKEMAIGRMWEKLHDLQQQERALQNEGGR